MKKVTWREKIKNFSELLTAIGVIGAAAVGVGSWVVCQINNETNMKLDSIAIQLGTLEQDSARTQLLTLMSSYPDNESEIMKVAYHYFHDLNGDWYMTELFSEWATARDINVDHIVKLKGD